MGSNKICMKALKHYRTCNLCEAMCGLEITHENGEILSIKGDKNDPLSKGHICPKALALKDVYEDSNRLKKPVIRKGDHWEEISWKKAIDTVTSRITEVQKNYGQSSVGIYNGNPVVHNSGTILSVPSFFRELRTKNRYSATSVDQLPHQYMAYLMFGHQLMLPIPDIDRTEYVIIMGANPLVSNGSLLTAPNMKKRLQKIQERDGKVVNIDPRFTETSAKCDHHIFIRPGTDVFLLLAFVHVLFDEGLVKLGRLADHVTGLKELEELTIDYSPQQVANITGIEAQIVTTLVREFCQKDRAVLYGRMGVCTQEFGGLSMWLVNVVNILTGNFDEPGGAMFTTPAIDVKPFATKGHINKWSSRVRKLPEFANELPVASLAEDILQEGDGQIKGMIINSGNPVLSTPNGAQLREAFKSLDFMVSIDIYINETSSLANIILPPATGLEVDHYDIVFHSLAIRNTTKYSEALYKPANGMKYDWQIFKALKWSYLKKAGRYGLKKMLSSLIDPFVTPKRLIAAGLKRGPYKHLNMNRLKKEPHGIDLGELKSQLPNGLYTSNKKINLLPSEIKNDLGRAREKFKNYLPKPGSFMLIGRRQLRTCNSWLHNSNRMLKNNECTLYIHPKNADEIGLNETGMASVKSRVGCVTLPFERTSEIMEGTVSIPHGWGHFGDIKMDVATTNPGISINELTDDQFIDQLTGNAALNGIQVEVAPVLEG